MANLFVPRETTTGERRVAATPDSVGRLTALGLDVRIERGAGDAAGYHDVAYAEAGADLVDEAAASEAQLIVRVAPPTLAEVERISPGAVLISFMAPHRHLDVVMALAARKVTTLAMDLVPRITRAQAIDALSSQANVAGYRAAVEAAYALDKYFPLFMTAAGTIRPARVVVLGAGVAGLQAVATARRLGAVVHVSDIREAAREEVLSLGGNFIDVPEATDATGAGGYAAEVGEDFLARQRRVLTDHLREADAVITTAQLPSRPAPTLVTQQMVEAMRPGALLIDLAAADGGNCVLTDVTRVVEHNGVRIVPGHAFASDMPGESSALYARNIHAFCELLLDGGEVALDLDDEIVAGAMLTHDGTVTAPQVIELLNSQQESDA